MQTLIRYKFLVFVIILFIGCNTSKSNEVNYYKWKGYKFFTTPDTISLTIKYHVCNEPQFFTKYPSVPYTLIIGETSNKIHYITIPKIISVLLYDEIGSFYNGQIIKILPTKNPIADTTFKVSFLTKDTLINKENYHVPVGSEYPAILGKVIR